MARVTLLPPGLGVPFIYNVDMAVGAGCRINGTTFCSCSISWRRSTATRTPSARRLRRCRSRLARPSTLTAWLAPLPCAIKHFQDVARSRGNNIATDGRIDKATGSGAGATMHTQFTIIFLNNGYRTIRPSATRTSRCWPATARRN